MVFPIMKRDSSPDQTRRLFIPQGAATRGERAETQPPKKQSVAVASKLARMKLVSPSRPYVAVIQMMAGLQLSLVNSQNADTAGADAQRKFKPGDQLLGVFGIDEAFVHQLEKFAADTGYAGAASRGGSAIPFLAVSAASDGHDVELHCIAARTAIAAAAMAQKTTSPSRYRAVFSLEPAVLGAMKMFLVDREPVKVNIM
jgi:hypothetical protein